MSPETVELTLRAQEVLADAARVRRQTAENLRLMRGQRERLIDAAQEFEEAADASRDRSQHAATAARG
jgi:hypothetical protein